MRHKGTAFRLKLWCQGVTADHTHKYARNWLLTILVRFFLLATDFFLLIKYLDLLTGRSVSHPLLITMTFLNALSRLDCNRDFNTHFPQNNPPPFQSVFSQGCCNYFLTAYATLQVLFKSPLHACTSLMSLHTASLVPQVKHSLHCIVTLLP